MAVHSPHEAAGQRHRAALAEAFGAGVGLDAEGGDVDKHRLVFWVADREAQLADVAVIAELLEDRVGGQIPTRVTWLTAGAEALAPWPSL